MGSLPPDIEAAIAAGIVILVFGVVCYLLQR